MKMPIDSLAIKKDYQKRVAEDIKVFLRTKQKKSNNMGCNYIKTSPKMKNQSWLNIEKNNRKSEKSLHYNKFCVSIKHS